MDRFLGGSSILLFLFVDRAQLFGVDSFDSIKEEKA